MLCINYKRLGGWVGQPRAWDGSVAILFKQLADGKSVEVRSAGASRRLYVDGVLHSQFNARTPLTGDVWDALALSAFFAPQGRIRRVLFLGLGGGAAIHLLRRYLNPTEIVAVELDALKIKLARRFFDIDAPNTELVHAEARRWAEDYQGPLFDLIIDDLFGETAGEPHRAIAMDREWAQVLCGLLSPGGFLTVNFVSKAELMASALVRNRRLAHRFGCCYRYAFPQAENAVTVFGTSSLSRRSYRERLRRYPGLDTAEAHGQMRFRLFKLW